MILEKVKRPVEREIYPFVVNNDKKKGKSTLIKLLGYKKTLEFALNRKKMIINKLNKYGVKSNQLIKTTNFILDRSY